MQPFLYIGITDAVFHEDGRTPSLKDLSKIESGKPEESDERYIKDMRERNAKRRSARPEEHIRDVIRISTSARLKFSQEGVNSMRCEFNSI